MRHMTLSAHSRRALALAAAFATFGVAQSSFATNRTWNNTGTDFNATGSWDTAAPGTGDFGVFATDKVTDPALSSSKVILGLTFNGAGYTLSSASPATTLTLTQSGGTSVITQSVAGNNIISAPIVFGGAAGSTQSLNLTAGNLTLSGALSNTNAVTVSKKGAGVLTLAGDNSAFTGTITSSDNTAIHFASSKSLGAGTLSIGLNYGSGTIDNTSGAAMVSATNPIINLSTSTSNPTTLYFTGSNSLNVGTGAVMLGTTVSRNVNVAANRLTFGGSLTDAPSGTNVLDKTGNGILELAGQQNSTANTRISESVLLLSHVDALPTGNLTIRSKSTAAPAVLGLGAGDFTRALGTGAGQVQFVGGGGYNAYGGFAAYGATRNVNLGGNATPDTVTWNTGGFIASYNTFILSAASADATVNFKNPINLASATSNAARTIQVDNGSAAIDAILSGQISSASGTNTLTKTGDGTLALTGNNTYVGNTTVSAGTLLINGTNAGAGAFTVDAAGTLGGTGSNAGTVTVNGTLSPGASPGTLSVDALNVNADATYLFEGGDLTAVTHQLDLNDNWTLALGGGLKDGGTVTLFTYGTLAASPDLAPTFDLSHLGFTPSGSLSLSSVDGSIVLNGVSVVPEPATLSLLAIAGLVIGRRRSSRGV
jgi:autotransporter-associated beta strand protein